MVARPLCGGPRRCSHVRNHAATVLSWRVPRTVEELLADVDSGERPDFLRLAKLAVELTGFGSPTEPLSAVSRHYEKRGNRAELRELLTEIFGNKQTATPTHALIARAARHHLSRAPAAAERHYCILTTNYDSLMEAALSAERVPFVVLTTRGDDGLVCASFGGDLPGGAELEAHNGPAPPGDFLLDLPGDLRLTILYKMHGSLDATVDREVDSVVISDRDYVRFIARMWGEAMGVIPAEVSRVMERNEFLFLGYSLRDWNVRGIFEKVLESRKFKDEELVDYTVVNAITEYDEAFLDHSVQVLRTDLNAFVAEIEAREPRPGGERREVGGTLQGTQGEGG